MSDYADIPRDAAPTVVRAKSVFRRMFSDIGAFGALLALIGLGLTAIGAAEWGLRAAQTQVVSVAAGRIEAKWVEYGFGARHAVAYSFYDGRHADPVRVMERVPEGAFMAMTVGQPVEVAFDPSAPERSRLLTERPEGLARLFVTLGLLAMAGGCAQLGLRAREALRAEHLVRDGDLVVGRVVRILPTQLHIRRARQHRIEYGFDAGDGVWRGGLSAHAPRGAFARLEQGSPVHVFVDPAEPRRHALARDVLEPPE